MVITILASLLLQGQSITSGTTIYFPLVFKNAPNASYATSYYIQNADPAFLYQFGCELGMRDASIPGQQDSLVILDFGKMWIFDEGGQSIYGVRLFTDDKGVRRNISFEAVKNAAKGFATGYWQCSGSDRTSQLTLGIGTNNYDHFNSTHLTQDNLRGLAMDFGRNWAKMINDLDAWGMNQGYTSQILFTGAIDIEWGLDNDNVYRWNTPFVTRGWVDAFDTNDLNKSIFFNYGACVGCPTVPNLSWKYSTAMPWTQADVWYVSWGSKPAFAVPEIYRNDGTLARQWAAVSKYGALYQASRIVFSGVMTQMQACQQPSHRDGSCDTLDNTPAEGWSQLVDAINMDAYTVSPNPRWSTDIKWQYD